jgi:hypothetical protein
MMEGAMRRAILIGYGHIAPVEGNNSNCPSTMNLFAIVKCLVIYLTMFHGLKV